MNSKTLNLCINDYRLIKLNEIYVLKNTNYKMYAILSFKRFYCKNLTQIDDGVKIECYNTDEKFDLDLLPKFEDESQDELIVDIKSNYLKDVLIYNDKETIIISDAYAFGDYPSFKIEYIGISIEQDISDRLSNHTTLQKIMADSLTNHLNEDFYILLFNPAYFEVKAYGAKDGENKSDEEIAREFVDEFGNYYSEQDKIISLTEMMLINHFKPEYNKEYKKSNFYSKFKTLKNLYMQEYDDACLNLCIMQNDYDKNIKLYTELIDIQFNGNEGYSYPIKCKFKLK